MVYTKKKMLRMSPVLLDNKQKKQLLLLSFNVVEVNAFYTLHVVVKRPRPSVLAPTSLAARMPDPISLSLHRFPLL